MRKRRFKPERAVTYYHLMTRTAQQCFWLEEHNFREKVQEIIQFYCRVYYVDLLRFAVLGNHYHVVVKARKTSCDAADIRARFHLAQSVLRHPQIWNESRLEHFHRRYSDISMFAWEINFHSATNHNRMFGTSGHFWGSRFKSQIVEGGESLLKVMTYVDLNAFAANMVEDPQDYPHCSAYFDNLALQRGENPQIYPAGFLQRLPKKQQGLSYLIWLKYLAVVKRGKPLPSSDSQALSIEKTSEESKPEIDFLMMAQSYQDNPPPGLAIQVYGTLAFIKELTTENSSHEIREEGTPTVEGKQGSRPPPQF